MTRYSDSSSSTSLRPTLPPLHTLNLLTPAARTAPDSADSYEFKSCYKPPQTSWNHNRQISISSPTTSRSPSPFMPDYFARRSFSPSAISPPGTTSLSGTPDNSTLKVRLVPCSFEMADAYVYVPPSSTTSPATPSIFSNIRSQLHGNQPLLLVGPAARQLRQPSQKIAKGARVHPYRIASGARKSSLKGEPTT